MWSSAAVNRWLRVGPTARGPALGTTPEPAPVVPVVPGCAAPVVPACCPGRVVATGPPPWVAAALGAAAPVGATVGRSWLSRVGGGADEQAARAAATATTAASEARC